MSSNNNSLEINSKVKSKKRKLLGDDLLSIVKKYGITISTSLEDLVTESALKGQELLINDQIDETREISDFLLQLAKQSKDNFILMKALILQSQLYTSLNKDPLPLLVKAASLAKKFKLYDIMASIKLQVAFEYYKNSNYKKVLKEIRSFEEYNVIDDEITFVLKELKAKSYWELDDYTRGFDATYDWLLTIKETENLQTIFISIVYLLTVIGSLTLPHPKERIEEIKNEINAVLANIGSSVHLLDEVLENLGTLFAQSLMLVEPEILHNFADLLLKSVRWSDQEKFLIACKKLSDAFESINDFDKSIEILDKAITYSHDRKFKDIETDLYVRKVEISSLIFYFVKQDELFDPYYLSTVDLYKNGTKTEEIFDILSVPINRFASTSYSHFLRIIEKTAVTSIRDDTWFEIQYLPESDIRSYFLLNLEIANEEICLLMKEDFQVEVNSTTEMSSTVTPYYSVIGVLHKENDEKKVSFQNIEEVLLKLQRAINCPASKASIIFPKAPPHLNVFKYYIEGGKFRDIKIKLLECALEIRRMYSFVKNKNFLKIFESDPITIFDLSLREENHLNPIITLLNKVHHLNIKTEDLSNFFKDLFGLFLKRADCRYWRDFYYQYAWVHLKGELLSKSSMVSEQKIEHCNKLIEISKKLKDNGKILESNYYKALQLILLGSGFKNEALNDLKLLSNQFQSEKYLLLSELLEDILSLKENSSNLLKKKIISLFFDLCEYRDWDKARELFNLLLETEDNYSELMRFSIQEMKKGRYAICLQLEILSRLIETEQHEVAFDSLGIIIHTLKEIKEKQHYKTHLWTLLFVRANLLLYTVLKISKYQKNDFAQIREEIVNNILELFEWVTDKVVIVELLIEKAKTHLDKSEYALAEKLYHRIEQQLLFNWDIFMLEENKNTIKITQDIKKRIVGQHFT